MDKYDIPSLLPPMIALLLASFCVAISRIERLPDEMRVLFVLFAAVLGTIGAFTLWNWLAYRGAIWLEDIRSAWNAPTLRLAESVASMNHEQLALMGMISPFRSEARMAGGQVQWWLHTPLVDIPFGWVSEYLEACEITYPALLPQHGKPDALNRDYIRGFTGLMVTNGLATQAAGNKAARWNVPLADVAKRLGLE